MIFCIVIEVFNIRVLFQLGEFDHAALEQFIKDNMRDFDMGMIEEIPHPGDVLGRNYRKQDRASSLVWVCKIPETREDEAIVVHEIVHAVQHAIYQRGLSGEEADAYMTDFLYQKAMENIDAWKKENRVYERQDP